jgi:hypothetical protein
MKHTTNRIKFLILAGVLLLLPAALFAHRLDEYLEATIFSVDSDHVEGSMRLVPGVAVSSAVIGAIDADGDGRFSQSEQQAYAERVLSDLSLSVDGLPLALRLLSCDFPSPGEMKQGIGEIHLAFTAQLPAGGVNRRLVFENHHQPRMAVYLVNSLVPTDRNIQIAAQSRNQNQSVYALDFTQARARHASYLSFSGFAAAFRLGLRHIAEGTDHLLFLLTLLLPASMQAFAARWSGIAGVRATLLNILRIVTAFTLGHSLTLALSAFGLLTLPSRPVEVLIAVSILVSAIHALRPLFPGREAAIAAVFGLIHGLAFASALSNLGFNGWYRMVTLVGFNLGIETMQLAVVAATLPSLLLLSRTRAYSALRITGALFAAVASLNWIAERLLNIRTAIDSLVETAAQYGVQLTVALFLVSLACWFAQKKPAAAGMNGESSIEGARYLGQ